MGDWSLAGFSPGIPVLGLLVGTEGDPSVGQEVWAK